MELKPSINLDKPSREADWNISNALGNIPKHTVREIGFDYDWYRNAGDFWLRKAIDSEGRQIESWSPPAYTESIDAALSLVPEGWSALLAIAPHKTICDVHVKPIGEVGHWPGHATAPTPALAICRAVLKARGIE